MKVIIIGDMQSCENDVAREREIEVYLQELRLEPQSDYKS